MFLRNPANPLIITGFFIAAIFLAQPLAAADTVDVSIPGFSFDPADITIAAGTTVRWTNNHSITHTSTSDNAIWDSGDLTMGQSFLFTFESAGVFPYHCTYHPQMLGTVTVNESRPVPALSMFGVLFLILLILISAWWIYRRHAAKA
jgi:plastocyanin